jgi:hypothetical protein
MEVSDLQPADSATAPLVGALNTIALQRIQMTWRVPLHLSEPPKPRGLPTARFERDDRGNDR